MVISLKNYNDTGSFIRPDSNVYLFKCLSNRNIKCPSFVATFQTFWES